MFANREPSNTPDETNAKIILELKESVNKLQSLIAKMPDDLLVRGDNDKEVMFYCDSIREYINLITESVRMIEGIVKHKLNITEYGTE